MKAEVYLAVVLVAILISAIAGVGISKAARKYIRQEYKKTNIRKIPVGLVFEDAEDAKLVLHKLEPQPFDIVVHNANLIETRSLLIYLIKAGTSGFLGSRLSFVYTTKEIAESEWFKAVIRPMLTGGIGEIV